MSLEAACGMFFWRTCTVATKLCLGYFSCLIPNQYIHSFNSSMHRFSGSKGPTIRQLGLVIFTVKWTKRVLRSIRQSCTPNFDCSYIYIYSWIIVPIKSFVFLGDTLFIHSQMFGGVSMVWNCWRCQLRLVKHKTEVDVVSLRDASLEFTMGIPELTNIEWIFNSADTAHMMFWNFRFGAVSSLAPVLFLAAYFNPKRMDIKTM